EPQDPIPNLNPVSNPSFFSSVNDAAGTHFFLNSTGLALIGSSGTGVNDAANMVKIPGVNKLSRVRNATGMTLGFTPNNFFFAHAPFHTNGFAPATDYVYSQQRSSRFNFNQSANSYPEQERYGGYASFNDKVCSDQLQVCGD